MEIGLFIKGLIIGISIAAPVGPIGVLCIQRTLAGGTLYGISTGFGAATADAIYGLIAAFGLTFISHFLVEQQNWFRFLGGIFLCYLGVRAFLSRPVNQSDRPAPFPSAPVPNLRIYFYQRCFRRR